jgi:hypothetical protein
MKLNQQTIPTPKKNVQIEYNEISKSSRVASGLMVKDIIAVKRIFSLSYNGLKPEEALIFINAYKAGESVEFEFDDIEGIETAKVFVTALPREIYIHEPNYTKNVKITLEEE